MKRIGSVDFARAVCSIGIVCFHFACYGGGNGTLRNGDWGHIFVTVFFLLSGGMLLNNHESIPSIKLFYYKRWKSIYPSFYIAYSVFFLENVLKQRAFFYKLEVNPFTIILSILGLDGYLAYAIPNYYILGEWFLGAIVILYLVYPVILYFFKRYSVRSVLVSAFLFFGVYFYNVFSVSRIRNLLTCVFLFMMGMTLFRYSRVFKSKYSVCISTLVCVACFCITVPSKYTLLTEVIFSICFFNLLLNIGNVIMRVPFLNTVFSYLASISYQIFLLQNVLINKVLIVYYPRTPLSYWLTEAFTIFLVVICAALLKKAVGILFKSKTYQDFESILFKKSDSE